MIGRNACSRCEGDKDAADVTLIELLPFVQFSERDLARVQAEIVQAATTQNLSHQLIGERVTGLVAFNDPADTIKFVMEGGMIGEDDAKHLEAAHRTHMKLVRKNANLVISLLVFPPITPTIDAIGRALATHRISATALAIKRYQRVHGNVPANLSELVPKFLSEVPKDPFDGQSIRYVRDANQVILYSVGYDGRDDDASGDVTDMPDIVRRMRIRSR